MITATSHPKRLAHYEVIELIDSTGGLHIYRAKDVSSQRDVILKVVVRDFSDQEISNTLSRFSELARISARLRHSGIVEIYEYGEDGPLAFLASEFVEGCKLKPQTRVPVADAASLIVQLLDALEYAHHQGVVHCGVKPSSLLLTSKGQLKITDFGVSDFDRTSTYLAPEHSDGSSRDPRVDLFAAGVLFYELLTGARPFSAKPENAIHVGYCEPPSKTNADVPAGFDSVCATALQKRPKDRYSSAYEFCDDVCRAYQEAFGSSPSRVVSNETVVSIFLDTLRGDLRKKRSSRSNRKAALNAQSVSSGPMWDEKTLRRVAQELSAFIGPLATAVVKEAASSTNDLDTLYKLAAESLGILDERNAFLSGKLATFVGDNNPAIRSGNVSGAASSQSLAMSLEENKPAPKPEIHISPASWRQVEFMPWAVSTEKSGGKKVSGRDLDPEPKPKPKSGVVGVGKLGSIPRVQAQAEQSSSSDLSINSRLEEVLGKQPENLAGYLKQGPPEVNEIVHAFVAATDALRTRYADKNRSLGLTPENICFDRLGRAQIRVSSSTVVPGSTMGGAMGSPRYAAPEIFAEKNDGIGAAPASADIYALGFMFYEILLGRELFRTTFAGQRSDLDWLRWHSDLKSEAPLLKQLLPEHPAALSELLESMIAKDTATRLSDLSVILTRLRIIAQQAEKTMIARTPVERSSGSAGLPANRQARKGRGMEIVVLVLALVLCAAFVWQNLDLYRRFVIPVYRHYFAPDSTRNPPPNSE